MAKPRINFLVQCLLASGMVAVSFAAGYFLFRKNPAVTVAESSPAPTTRSTRVTSAPATESTPSLHITKATYGAKDHLKDVTDQVAALVDGGKLTVDANNETFGDPAEGLIKTLRVEYIVDGVPSSRAVEENKTLRIVARTVSKHIVIRHAIYGDLPNGPSADVTDAVRDMVGPESLSVEASNENFDDPALNILKKLRVDYTFDGVEKSKTVQEGETLTISKTGD